MIRLCKKIFLVLVRGLIKSLNFVRPRLYMRLYNAYLEKLGDGFQKKAKFIHSIVRFDGKNCIIRAASIVKGSIPDNYVVCGNPATCIANMIEYASRKKLMILFTTNMCW